MAFLLGTRNRSGAANLKWPGATFSNRCLQTLCFSSFTCGGHLPDDNVIRYTVNQKRTQFGCSESLVLQPHNRDKELRSSALLRLRCVWQCRQRVRTTLDVEKRYENRQEQRSWRGALTVLIEV